MWDKFNAWAESFSQSLANAMKMQAVELIKFLWHGAIWLPTIWFHTASKDLWNLRSGTQIGDYLMALRRGTFSVVTFGACFVVVWLYGEGGVWFLLFFVEFVYFLMEVFPAHNRKKK